MQETDLFFIYTDRLNQIGARYMVSGSVASTVYGEPRLTNDIDIIVELREEHIIRLLELFPGDDFYCPPEEVIHVEVARSQRGHFNLIHHKTGFKADIYPMGRNPLHLWGIEHSRRIDFDAHTISFAPPEYVIVKKLEFYREGHSEKHLRDIRSILECLQDKIDYPQIDRFVRDLRLEEVWDRVR